MGGKALLAEDGKYTVTFVIFGKRDDKDVKAFMTDLEQLLVKHDARNVERKPRQGADVAAEKAASVKFGIIVDA